VTLPTVELRESADSKQKKKTEMRVVNEDGYARYDEVFVFDVASSLVGELRVQLFKKADSVLQNKAVVANAGIYVKNIVAHVTAHGTIEKDFKLFSKDGVAMGGSVRLAVEYRETNGTRDGATGKNRAPASASPVTSARAGSGDENAHRVDDAHRRDDAAVSNGTTVGTDVRQTPKGKKPREETDDESVYSLTDGLEEAIRSYIRSRVVAAACGVLAVAALAARIFGGRS